MSRTDKTKPFWVKLMHGDLECVEQHNHTDGHCDLPPITDGPAYTYGTTNCRRDWLYTGTKTCCCTLCRAYEIRPSKRARLDRKQQLRQWAREY